MSVEKFTQLAQDFAQSAGDMAPIYMARKPPVPLQEAYMGRLSIGSKHVVAESPSSLFPEDGLFDEQRNGLLHYAAEGINGALVKRLATEWPSLAAQQNNIGRTPLHTAVWAEKKDAVKALAKFSGILNVPDYDGSTALLIATSLENVELVKILLKAKANPNQSDKDGMSPLHFASALGDLETVQLLLEANADASALDQRGRNPLHYACMNQNNEIATLLSTYGASEYEPDCSGKTAEQYQSMAIEGDKRVPALVNNAREKANRKIAVG